MAWVKSKELRYQPAGAPASNLTDFAKRFYFEGDGDIAAEYVAGGSACGFKVTSPDGLTDYPFGFLDYHDPATGTVHVLVQLDPLTAASSGDPYCLLWFSATESSVEDKAGVTSSYAFYGVPGDYSGDVMMDWVSGNTYAGSGGLSTSNLVPGVWGQALEFDGGDDSVNGGSLSFTDAITIEAIFTRTGAGNTYFDQVVLFDCAGSSPVSDDAHGLDILNDNLAGFVNWDGGVGSGNRTFVTGSTTLNNGVTYSGAFSVDPSGVANLYLDGQNDGTGSFTNTGVYDITVWAIGRFASIADGFLDGAVGTVRISSVARSADWLAYQYIDDFTNSDTFTVGPLRGSGEGPDFTTPGFYAWQVPSGVTEITVKCWGGGQSGFAGNGSIGGDGGSGGDFAEAVLSVTPGEWIDVFVGQGGEFGGSGFPSGVGDGSEVRADGAGSFFGSVGDVTYSGGSGGSADSSANGGGGGGGAGSAGNGSAGDLGTVGGAGGAGGSPDGGTGGTGGFFLGAAATDGSLYGGGGGGGASDSDGGFGVAGRVLIEWDEGGDMTAEAPVATLTLSGLTTVTRKVATSGLSTLTLSGIAPIAYYTTVANVGTLTLSGLTVAAQHITTTSTAVVTLSALSTITQHVTSVDLATITFTGISTVTVKTTEAATATVTLIALDADDSSTAPAPIATLVLTGTPTISSKLSPIESASITLSAQQPTSVKLTTASVATLTFTAIVPEISLLPPVVATFYAYVEGPPTTPVIVCGSVRLVKTEGTPTNYPPLR